MLNFKDLMDAAGGSFEPLPKTAVEAVVTEATVATTSTNKTMFKMTWSVVEGPYVNRKLWGNQVVSPESPPALGIFFRQMAAIGLDSNFFATNPSEGAIAQAMVGKRAKLLVDQKEYQGTLRNEIKDIQKSTGTAGGLPVPAGGQAPIPGLAIPVPTSDPGQAPGVPSLPF